MPTGNGRRLVLAEDDHDLREALALAMRRDGYEVIEIEDGWALLRYLTSQLLVDSELSSVDVVISDVRMPGKSGLDVLAGARWSGRSPPFILITAFNDPPTEAEARRLGAAAWVTKPFSLDRMRELVRAVESQQAP